MTSVGPKAVVDEPLKTFIERQRQAIQRAEIGARETEFAARECDAKIGEIERIMVDKLHAKVKDQRCETCHTEHKGREGTVADWQQTLMQSGFVFRNPNVKTACGCGESFNV